MAGATDPTDLTDPTGLTVPTGGFHHPEARVGEARGMDEAAGAVGHTDRPSAPKGCRG